MIAESLTSPGADVLMLSTCIGIPAAGIWVRTVGITRILAVVCASIYAMRQAYIAAKVRYREVYRTTLEWVEETR
jgi:hypothetical protein